jgi:glutamate/tyrosine decarboxylase-like PLP-dependent enzyme
MDIMEIAKTKLNWLPPKVVAVLEKYLKKIPSIREKIEKEYEPIMADLENLAKPYRNEFESYKSLPKKGKKREEILNDLRKIKSKETKRWQKGFVSGAVYHGDNSYIDFMNNVYAITSQSNPLHSDIWPSNSKYESEIISMTAKMLGAEVAREETGDEVCGAVSSGGTESILLAMKVYRDWARDKKRITRPNMVMPSTAHVAFDKAAQYFNIKRINVPIDANGQVDPKKMKKAVNRRTIVIVGSAPAFPHGVIDPIEEMSEFARQKGIGFHTDGCLGGFLLPWARKLGYDVPPFDFGLKGVTTISADTHKFGYAAKGTSVVLYRNQELRRYQYFTSTDWPGGLYFSPTFAGSRSGALSAVCWAAMVSLGEDGYLRAAKKILETAVKIQKGIEKIPELKIIGYPLFVISFTSETLDIYRIMDFMTKKNWNLNGLHKPSCVHLCVTLRHTGRNIADRFLNDLKSAVKYVKKNPSEEGGMAPVYGMAATLPMRGVIRELLKRYMDILYKV